MISLVAQIAPQRSTQYAELATALAPIELQLSPLGELVSAMAVFELCGQPYLKVELTSEPEASHVRELGTLAMMSAFFFYHEKLGEYVGPFLRPLETPFQPFLSPDLVTTRRYRGKTNELFTHFLCNLARFSSEFAHKTWHELYVFDPLAGGGTTLFSALVLGANVVGVEKNSKDVESTVAFLKQYVREGRIACRIQEERLRKIGKRWQFHFGRDESRRCVLASGDTIQSAALLTGIKKPHLIVTDLPYGIQHHGQLEGLLREALPVWASLLPGQGAVAFAWDATRFPREEMVALVESASPLRVLDEAPYNRMAHRVDRVIKQRDVIVARPV